MAVLMLPLGSESAPNGLLLGKAISDFLQLCGASVLEDYIERKPVFPHERRKRLRVNVKWTVRLSRNSDDPSVETRTEDISSEGFYCVCEEPFTAGEHLECLIMIPAHHPSAHEGFLGLRGRARVVRVETVGDAYGVAFRLEDYTAVPLNPAPIP